MDDRTVCLLLLASGAICIVVAIVGGGLSVSVVSIPQMTRFRQSILAIFGAVLAFIGFVYLPSSSDSADGAPAQGAAGQVDAGTDQRGNAPASAGPGGTESDGSKN